MRPEAKRCEGFTGPTKQSVLGWADAPSNHGGQLLSTFRRLGRWPSIRFGHPIFFRDSFLRCRIGVQIASHKAWHVHEVKHSGLQNTVDMMRVLQEMYADGEPVSAADVEYLSPYMTSGIKRFGNYHLDLKRPPEPWVKESQFREAAKRARAAAAAVAAEGQRAGQKGAGA